MTSEPVNLTELNKDEFKQFLNGFDHIFSDCDGVLWSPLGPLPGVDKFIQLVKQQGKSVHYVSNNSLSTRDRYERHFKAVQVDDGFERLTIPSIAIAEYLKSKNLKKKVFCVTCEQTVKVLESYGFTCEYGPDIGPDDIYQYIEYLKDDEEIGAVVFDSDFRVNVPKLYKAITYLRRPEVLFLNGATDRIVPLRPGIKALGVQVFTDLVCEEVNRQPVQLAKPGVDFGKFAMKRAGVTDPSRVLFIGDMIKQDIGLGINTGFKTLLVLNTLSKEDMIADTNIRPDYYAPSLGSIVPQLE